MATSSKPNFSQGWGVAGLIMGMAIGAFLLAGFIKSRTFHSPNDVTVQTRGSAEHAPAAAEHAPAAEKH